MPAWERMLLSQRLVYKHPKNQIMRRQQLCAGLRADLTWNRESMEKCFFISVPARLSLRAPNNGQANPRDINLEPQSMTHHEPAGIFNMRKAAGSRDEFKSIQLSMCPDNPQLTKNEVNRRGSYQIAGFQAQVITKVKAVTAIQGPEHG